MKTFLLLILLFTVLFSSVISQPNPPVVGSFGNPLSGCPYVRPSPTPPTSISKLRPSDVRVMAALGDSITAAFGVDGFWGGPWENRGYSWAMGAASDAPSLFNFMKRYSPNIYGGSLGSHFVEICADWFCPSPHEPAIDVFNAAQSGAWAENLPDQATWLINQMKKDPHIDYLNDWKVITILIGANNLCASCLSIMNPINSVIQFEQAFNKTLQTLTVIPKTFVNVVQIFNVSQVYNLTEPYQYCKNVHQDFPVECQCAFGSNGDANRAKMDNVAAQYRQIITNVVNKIQRRSDFAVVIQPVLSQGKIPGIEYLSNLDCFHPSHFGHRSLAIATWNSMLLPKAQKPITFNPASMFAICPNNNTLLYID